MTESEWLACDDPARLLAATSAGAESLRRLACLCCRRILDHYPPEWAQRVFDAETATPGPWISPADWQPAKLLEAIAIAEAFIAGKVTAGMLLAASETAAALSNYRRFEFANQNLGDSAAGAEYEVGYICWQSGDAVAACCAAHIRASVAESLRCAAEAIGFRWKETEKRAAVAAEQKAQSALLRSLITFRDTASDR